MARDFMLPDLGEGIAEAQIVRLLVKEGEQINEDQYLMEVETDKAAVEIPSPYGGKITRLHVKEGQTVNVGAVIVSFDDGAGAMASGSATSGAARAGEAVAASGSSAASSSATAVAEAPPRPSAPGRTSAPAAPAVRKLARELGVNLDSITGTGPGSRVTKEDVERQAAGASASAGVPPTRGDATLLPASRRLSQPAGPLPGIVDADKWGPIRREPLSQIRKTIANQMSRSAFTAVHVTHNDNGDISELDRMRHRLNQATGNDPKLTVMSFVIRAVCLALRKHPSFNASLDDEHGQIIYKDYVNMGIAVDTERGLIVPVIRNADQLGLRGIAAALRTIADRIRTNQFAIEDLRGGTFTITNVGALGGSVSTPIINYPEVAILGLGRSKQVPVIRDGKVEPALSLPINLSFDHRVTDGANAARFAGEIISFLETPERFLLD